MFLCNSTWSFHKIIPGEMKFLEFPNKCAELGIPAVELLDFHFEKKGLDKSYLNKVKKTCKDAGVKLACYSIGNDFTILDPKERKKQIDYVKDAIKIANYLEAPVIRCFCGSQHITDEAMDRVIQGYQEVMNDAMKYNVVLAMENHWGLSVNPDNVVKIIKGVYCPTHFGSTLDFGNWANPDRVLGAIKVAPFAKHAHAKSYVFDKKGEEPDINFKAIMAELKKNKYQGAVSIEFEGPEDQIQGTIKTAKLCKKYLK